MPFCAPEYPPLPLLAGACRSRITARRAWGAIRASYRRKCLVVPA